MRFDSPDVQRRRPAPPAGPKPPRDKRPGDGKFVGWCNRCGADVFDGPRHRCPPKLNAKAWAIINAAKRYRDARADLMCASGEFAREQAKRAEHHAFETLVGTLAALDEGTTITEETSPAARPASCSADKPAACLTDSGKRP